MDPQQETVLKKIAWRIVPLLTLAYVANYLDRTNIGFAALTMNKDLGFTATEFGYGAGILFLGYTVFEIPSNLALYRFGARRWIARIMITWGLVSALTALVVGVKSYYLARFALGVAEAGFFPGVTYYFAAWFPTQYRTRMLAWFLVAVPLSSVVGGPISGLLLELDGVLGLEGWQWLFIVEGIPAVILGIVVLRVPAGDRALALAQGARHPQGDVGRGTPRTAEIEPPRGDLGHPGHHPGGGAVRLYARLLRRRHLPAADHQDQRPLQYRGELPRGEA
jgi:MFS family permease